MPWKQTTKMELKLEFVTLANQTGSNMAQLCRRYGISRPTGYKWLRRYRSEGPQGLHERSRRPRSSPNKTPSHIIELVKDAREEDPGWGGRKLRYHLRRQAKAGLIPVDPDQIPSASTITAILRRNGLLDIREDPSRQGPWQRFEHEAPNDLWQMDFKGQFELLDGNWCYPLTVIDDHSRFGLAVTGCSNQRHRTVKEHLQGMFTRYGLPKAILCDNGPPWGSPQRFPDGAPHYTKLAAWLMRLGTNVHYSGPGHPQTHGKNERFNGTLKAELLRFERFEDQAQAQARMNVWRSRYNSIRPHQALDMATPASRYRPSPVAFPNALPAIQYGPDDEVRKVSRKGMISYRGESFRVGKAFRGNPVALRAGPQPDKYKVYFCHQHIRTVTLN